MKKIKGIPASSGLVKGKAFLWSGDITPEIPHYAIEKTQTSNEWERLSTARLNLIKQTDLHIENLKSEKNSPCAAVARTPLKDHLDILKAHKMMLCDDIFFEQVKAKTETQLVNIEWALLIVTKEMTQKLLSANDPYLRERAADISDMSLNLINSLMCIEPQTLINFSEDVIIIAGDIPPSAAFTMDRTHIKAIVLDSGTRTSHTSILARSFEIPAVVGCGSACKEIKKDDVLIVDGYTGEILINPNKKDQLKFDEKQKEKDKDIHSLDNEKKLPAVTKDGKTFGVFANAEMPQETDRVFSFGAEGIGLFRSEFLFLSNGKLMDEEEQYKAYCAVLKKSKKLPVTIRTIDVGGDKQIAGIFAEEEKNPLLGWRAIRFCLSMPQMFKVQLRAILRASIFGNARIMFPMISTIDELETALTLLEEAKNECREKQQKIAENISVGIMIEVPSAVLTADILAKKCNFFSIGTNDLMQYTLAIDRENEKVSYLAKNMQPALLRLIKSAIDAAHNAGIKVSMCGEMARDLDVVPILVGLGLDEFSMSAVNIASIKHKIRECSFEECKKIAEQSLQCSSWKDVEKLLKRKKSNAH
ncbi:MAG: phosphoenolpyruvate--protein phosphotransferase [Termitinemataceae bacterium]|nr:MAG: phosphoenolpyruvate--protein phosphotransferase [Termitinemataceae bacterium]